ncbi:MAG: FadR/GntR family transcriptional regulator [Janthinobacterium lividum]
MATISTSSFTPITAPRAFEQLSDLIRSLIASGTLKTGDKLPSERELAEQMKLSRGVVREALRTLEIAGLVELKKGGSGGAFIVAEQQRIVTQAYRDMVHLGHVTLGNLTEARQKFMVDAIELACIRATEEDFEALEANLLRTEKAIAEHDIATRRACTTEFYQLIGAASKNEVIVVIIDTMTVLLRSLYRNPPAQTDSQLMRGRRNIVKLLRLRQSARACREMVGYLEMVQHYLLAEGSTEVRGIVHAERDRAPINTPAPPSSRRRYTASDPS